MALGGALGALYLLGDPLEGGQRPAFLGSTPLSFAHRGGAAIAPEHTLLAYHLAVERYDIDVLELDVRPTADGHAILMHDARVDRTTDGTGRVIDLTLADLQRLDASAKFKPTADAPDAARLLELGPEERQALTRIPTLKEVLVEFSGRPEVQFNIEIKAGDEAFEEQVLQQLEAFGVMNRVCLAAFSDKRMARLADKAPGACLTTAAAGTACAALPRRLGLEPPGCGAHGLFALPDALTDAALIRALQATGRGVVVWVVDDPERMRDLLQWGVDGLMTDRPDRLAEVMAEYKAEGHRDAPDE